MYILHYIVLYRIISNCTVVYYIRLDYITLYYNLLYHIILYDTMLY